MALEQLSGDAEAVAADLSTEVGVAAVVQAVTDRSILDILVNNAGRAILAPFAEVGRPPQALPSRVLRARQTRSGVSGRSWNSAPVAWLTAAASAGAVQRMAPSLTPLAP